MKSLCIITLLIAALSAASAQASLIIDFDDLPTTLNSGGMLYGPMPLTYQGLTWQPLDVNNSWNVNNNATYKSVYHNTYDTPSTNNFVSNSGASTVTITGPAFDFLGAYFAPWTQNNTLQSWSASTITAKGYNGANLVGTVSLNLVANGYTWMNADLHNITELRLIVPSGKYWVMDNFTIPEPTSVAMIALGGLTLLRRRAL